MSVQHLAEALLADATFAAVLERLHAEKHTGPVTVHFAQGHPQTVELPCAPVRIRLTGRRLRAKLDTTV